MTGSPTHSTNLTNQMNIALPNYLMLIFEVPNDPQQALYPTSNAWLKLNAQLKLYNFSYLSILTVERFFNLNSKSFW